MGTPDSRTQFGHITLVLVWVCIDAPQMQRELKAHGHSTQRSPKPAAAASGAVAAASRASSRAEDGKESTGEEGKGDKQAAAEKKRAVTPAIDERFFNRLAFVMRIVVPRWNCKETFLLLTQVAVLVSRTMLSLRIARLGGDGLQVSPPTPSQSPIRLPDPERCSTGTCIVWHCTQMRLSKRQTPNRVSAR